jgi:hypothetical protein
MRVRASRIALMAGVASCAAVLSGAAPSQAADDVRSRSEAAAPRLSTRAAASAAPDRSPQRLCPVEALDVPEASTGVLGTVWAEYGDSVTVTPEPLQQIWAGVWLTGWNGPAGWADAMAPSGYPLTDVPRYGLIGRIGNGPWQYIGNRAMTFTNTKVGYRQKVVLRVNDNVAGNGDGAFRASISYACTIQ